MWAIQIKFLADWVELARDYKSQDDAEWAIAQWKAEMNCTGDSLFRAVPVDDVVPLIAAPVAGEPITDDVAATPQCRHCGFFLDTPAQLASGYCEDCNAIIENIRF